MIFAVTIALISILVLGAIVISVFFSKPTKGWEWFLIGLYTYNFLSEIAMLVLALNSTRNHFLANIHTLLYAIGMMIVLSGIWERLLGKKFPRPLILLLVIIYIFVWVADSFFIHDFHTFNTFSQAILFIANLCLVVYLLNVILFLRKTNPSYKVDRFLIISFLLYCFANVVIDSFYNYYMKLPDEVYNFISDTVLILGVASHFFVLLAIIWLAKARKYSLA